MERSIGQLETSKFFLLLFVSLEMFVYLNIKSPNDEEIKSQFLPDRMEVSLHVFALLMKNLPSLPPSLCLSGISNSFDPYSIKSCLTAGK